MDSKICRICCESEGASYIYCKNNDPLISAKIMYCCTNVSVAEGDGLPSHICSKCEEELTASYRFVLKCEATDKKLRSQVDTVTSSTSLYDYKPKVEVKIEDSVNSDHDHKYEDLHDDASDNYITLEDIKQSKLQIKRENSIGHNTCGTKKPYKKKNKFRESGTRTCSVCGRVCANKSTLITHMRSHTDEKPYQCPTCEKRYKDSGGLKRHIERNHYQEKRERNFICENCGKGFFSKNDVKIHMRTHTGETPYSCPLCPMRFTQVSAMLRHKKRHTGEKSHACTTCTKRFCTKEELKNHLRVHSNEKKFPCPLCSVLFKYQNNLKKHIKLHSEPNSYVCNHCGRTFNVKGNLKIHIDRQHSEKSGYCTVCSKNVSNMEIHMWRHTGERPLKCELCTSSFYELKALARHMNFRHKNTDKYKCSVEGCSVTFPSRPMLDFHTAKLHETRIPFPCDRCSRGFYRKNDLARHKIGTHKERLGV